MIVSEAHRKSVALRIPLWDTAENTVQPRQKIDQLEGYILLTGFYQGELAQERLETREKLDRKLREWDELVPIVRGPRKTNAAHEDAKRDLNPELHAELEDLKSTVSALTDEIERLERDYLKCSRVYTLISGS